MATVINRANICSIDGKYIIRRRRPFEKWYIFFLLLRDPLKWTAYLFGGSSSMATQRQVHFMCFFFFYLLDFQLNVAITNCSENGLSNFLMFCLNILNGDLFIDCVFSSNTFDLAMLLILTEMKGCLHLLIMFNIYVQCAWQSVRLKFFIHSKCEFQHLLNWKLLLVVSHRKQ